MMKFIPIGGQKMIVKHIHDYPSVMAKLLSVQAAFALTKNWMSISVTVNKSMQQNTSLYARTVAHILIAFHSVGHKISQLHFGIFARKIYVG